MCTNTMYYRNAMEWQSNLDVQKDDILDKKIMALLDMIGRSSCLFCTVCSQKGVYNYSVVFELVSIYTQAHTHKNTLLYEVCGWI